MRFQRKLKKMPSQTKRLQSVQNSAAIITNLHLNMTESRGGGVLSYVSHIVMCRPKG